jgi:hypothetical protein
MLSVRFSTLLTGADTHDLGLELSIHALEPGHELEGEVLKNLPVARRIPRIEGQIRRRPPIQSGRRATAS